MAQISEYEDLCSKENTQQAYELGVKLETFEEPESMSCAVFDDNCAYLYRSEEDMLVFGYLPTTQQVRGWLRKEKGINIDISSSHNTYGYSVSKCINNFDLSIAVSDVYFKDYGEAENKAIEIAFEYLRKKG